MDLRITQTGFTQRRGGHAGVAKSGYNERSICIILSHGGSGMKRTFKPGEAAPVSGLYELIGPRGGHTGKERTVAKGEVLPPPPKPGMEYKIAERARNKSGHNSR
jgi:hypothetical protein